MNLGTFGVLKNSSFKLATKAGIGAQLSSSKEDLTLQPPRHIGPAPHSLYGEQHGHSAGHGLFVEQGIEFLGLYSSPNVNPT